jgi:putative aldouronate transport system permease protein
MFEISSREKGQKVQKEYNKINRVSLPTNIVLHIIFALFAFACLAPLLLLIAISFTPEADLLRDGYRFIPRSFTTEAYEFLFKSPRLLINAYMVTIFVVIIGTISSLIITVLYAYPISRLDFPFRNFFSMYVVITMLFSGGLTATYLVNVNVLRLRNTIWALILPGLGNAFYIMIARTYFRINIPTSVLESARIDGASEMRTLISIVLPLSLPVLAIIGLFSTFAFWNDWFRSLLYVDRKELYTLQFVMMRALLNLQYLQQNMSNLTSEEAMMELAKLPSETLRMAMAVMSIGPIVIAYPFFQRYFISGLTVGAIKG